MGNGFDLCHGIKSSYYDFRDYLKIHYEDLVDLLEHFIDVPNLWSDFENNLGAVDLKKIVDHYVSKAKNDAMSFPLNTFEARGAADEISRSCRYVVLLFTDFLRSYMEQWIASLEEPGDRKLNCIDKWDRVISFNYTKTVETLYNVQSDQTYYIHNTPDTSLEIVGYVGWNSYLQNASPPEKGIVFGHGRGDVKPTIFTNPLPSTTYAYEMNYAHGQLENTHETLNDYFEMSGKNVDLILPELKDYLGFPEVIDKIYIIGHSLSKVDRQYFQEIANRFGPTIEYHVTYFREREKARIEKNVLRFLKYPGNVTYYDLSDPNNALFETKVITS